MPEIVTLRATWALREETAEDCARRLSRWLDHLMDIHPGFRWLRWSGLGQQVPTRDLRELCRGGDLARLFSKRRLHDTARKRIVADGYRFDAQTASGASHAVVLDLRAGTGTECADRTWLPNELSLSVIASKDREADIAMERALKPALLATVAAWEPDWAALQSTLRRGFSGRWPQSRFVGSWAIYLTEPLARRVTPPAAAIVERHSRDALFMSATADPFDANDPAHITAADALEASLEPLWRGSTD